MAFICISKLMEPLLISEIQLFQDKIIGKKWKSYIALFFDENQLGKPRIELYHSEAKRKQQDVSKVIILEQCVSIKPSKTENGVSFLKIHFRDDTIIQFSSEDLTRIIDLLSSICFPKKYVTIAPSTSLESPTGDDEIFDFPESYPMLKLKQVGGRESTEGFFSLVLSDSIQINGQSSVTCIPYSSLIWIATGEHCIGFDVENLGIFEFATGDAMLFVEHLRSYVRFSCNFTHPNTKTICRFSRYFHPYRQLSPGMSNNSTMDSVDSGGVYTKISSSAETSVSSLQLNDSDYTNKNAKNQLRRNPSAEILKHKISFLQKRKNESRTDFEESADRDFVRLQLPKSILSKENKSTSMKNLTVTIKDDEIMNGNIRVPRQTDI